MAAQLAPSSTRSTPDFRLPGAPCGLDPLEGEERHDFQRGALQHSIAAFEAPMRGARPGGGQPQELLGVSLPFVATASSFLIVVFCFLVGCFFASASLATR